MSESLQVETEGHTAPRHRIASFVEPIVEANDGRFIVAVQKQSLFRIIEILRVAEKYNKRVFFHDKNLRRILGQLSEIGYYTFPKYLIIETEDFSNDIDDCMIIISGGGKRLYLKMSNIAAHEDKLIEFKSDDTIIIAATPINGTEKEAVNMENEIYKEGGKIYSLDKKKAKSMHPSQEDLKMALYLFKPKYYFPVKGEFRHLIRNADIATMMGFTPDRIVICDNGQVATFKKRALVSMRAELELEDTLIDGNENWDVTGVVLKDREILSKDGVMIIGVALSYRTKEIVSGIDVQTRGLIYLKDADYVVKEVSRIMEETVVAAVVEDRYDNLDVRMEARDRITRYLMKEIGKRPMVLPVIIEMNV
jgi:ribonuclease J